MIRIILGVIVGFIVWSIIWVGGHSVLESVSPDWIGRYSMLAARAMINNDAFETDAMIAGVNLLLSFAASIISGYLASLIAGEYKRTTVSLGVILVLVGIAVEVMTWRFAPVWYHVAFLIFLLPMTMLGGRLRRSQ